MGGLGSPVALPCCYGHRLSRGGPASSGASLIYIQRDVVACILKQILMIMSDFEVFHLV